MESHDVNPSRVPMKHITPYIYIAFLSLFLIISCGRDKVLTQKEAASEKPSADQIQRNQGDIVQGQPVPDVAHVSSRRMIPSPTGFTSDGTFSGTLPCSDCSGIQMELTLFSHPEYDQKRYVLQQTYLSTRDGDQVYWDSGPWESAELTDGSQVLRLSKNDDEHRRTFQVVGSRVLRLLDREEQPIESTHNYSLYKLPS